MEYLLLLWIAIGFVGWVQAIGQMNEYAENLGLKGTHPEPFDFVMIFVMAFLGPLALVVNELESRRTR